ncbi:MAG: precorrin-2 C(20)-methyltransferase [Rhodospirillales bacterium]|nr:precorrin-2 C(20)-methyltransferase [Rhodospirillales bacterium]
MISDPLIWGLGLGPGDPELITLKALRILQGADVIVYPQPNDGDSLVRAIAAPYLPGGQAEIPIRAPMSTDPAPAQKAYDKAAVEIGELAGQGKKLAILCEGDPLFYGSFMYLLDRLAVDWPIGVVPGVSSLGASAAGLHMPLASRNEVVSVIPAPLEAGEIKRRIQGCDLAAIIKVGRHLDKVLGVLEELNLTGGARYIERASMVDQKILSMDELVGAKAPYFSIILVPNHD